jgi:hypothetical protein
MSRRRGHQENSQMTDTILRESDRPPVDVTALQVFLESIGSHADGYIFAHPGQTLYHYTDLGGLAGIVSNHDLWLTHLRYSNDQEELLHGWRIADSVLAELIASSARNSTRRRILAEARRLLEKSLATAVYVTCFCKEDNLLGQWRGYAGNGAGVSIEIDPFQFGSAAGHEVIGLLRLWKVFYDVTQQASIARQAVEFGLTFDNRMNGAQWRIFDALQFFIPTFKHPDFRDEEEWRLIFTPQPGATGIQPQFRVARGMLIPYMSLQHILKSAGVTMSQLPIRQVRVGPSTHRELNFVSTRLLLDRNGYTAVLASVSDTPYRS